MADVVIAGEDRVDLEQAVLLVGELGNRVVLCEGGPTLLGELVAADLLDELCLTVAPLMDGDPLPVAVSPPGAPLRHFALRHVLRDGDTLFSAMSEARMTDDHFGTIASSLDAALIVVTAAEGQQRAGCLVGFHSQSSIEPLRYCVWLSKANYTYRVALHSTHLAVHFLTSSDLPLAEWFGTRTGDGVESSPASGPSPVPAACRC